MPQHPVPTASAPTDSPPPLRAGIRLVTLLLTLLLGSLAAGATEPAAAPPPRDPIEGVWLGTVTGPQGPAEIGLEFFRTKRGTLIFKLNFPEMFTYAVPMMIPVEAQGGQDYAIIPNFDIHLHLAADWLAGTFGKGRLPLELRRGERFPPPPSAPQLPAGPAPLWKYHLGAGTWAAPVVADGVVYLGTSAGRFHAVRAEDGTSVWSWQGPNGFDGSAVVGADLVYVVDDKMNLVALDRTHGTLRWCNALHDPAIAGGPAPDNPTFNHRAATPRLLDGVLYCGSSDGGLYALDARTGAKLWRHEAKAPVFSGIGLDGPDALLFGTMDGSVVRLDRRTRRETLRLATGGGVVTTPVVAADRLVVGSRDYMLYGFDRADGAPAWRFSYWFSWIESTPAVVDGLLYVGASDFSRVTVLEPATGRVRWSTPVHGMNWGTPLVTPHRVFTGTVAQNIPGTAIAHTGGIVALDRTTGEVKWRMPAAPAPQGGFGGYAGSLALADGKVIAAGFDGFLIALPAE
jgi:outer membrane protein assembly factor BamB